MPKSKKPGKRSPARRTPQRKSTRRTPLAGFMKKLWTDGKLMDRFTGGMASREKVIEGSNLSPHHKNLVRRGCVNDIMAELAGVDTSRMAVTANTNGVIN